MSPKKDPRNDEKEVRNLGTYSILFKAESTMGGKTIKATYTKPTKTKGSKANHRLKHMLEHLQSEFACFCHKVLRAKITPREE